MLNTNLHYAAAFADNTIGNMLTTAVVPTLAHQDPRYYVVATTAGTAQPTRRAAP